MFRQDLADEEAQAMNAAQNPTSLDCLHAALQETPTWQTKPTWIAISTSDNTIPRNIKEWMGARIDAEEFLRIDTSHAAMSSQPNVVAELIDRAAQAS
jgi:pimeloyl-ACP methyl ester carboxylesterase